MFYHSPPCGVVSVSSKMWSFKDFCQDHDMPQYVVAQQRPMLFFSSRKWHRFRIRVKMMNFRNISSFTNFPYSFSLHQNEIISEFLSLWWISTVFHHWSKSDVLFLFTKMRWFENFFEHVEFQIYFSINQRPMFFFSSPKWHHFGISLTMMNFNNSSSLAYVWCSFPLHQNEIISEFLSRWWISTILHHWLTFDVLFLFCKMKSF